MAEIKGITIVIDGETTKLDKALRDINKNAAAVGRELTSVSRLLKMSPGNTTLITQKQKMLSDAVSTTSKKLEDLKDAQKQLDAKGVDENSKEYRKLQREIAYTDTKLEALKKEQIAFTAENSKLGQMSQKYKDIGDKMTTVGKKLSQTLSVAAGAGMALAVKSAVDYETAWTGVTKTVDGTKPQLDKIKQGILDLSQKTASSAVDIAAVAENAGQLGIKTKDILSFTKTMVMLGDTTNLSADEASSALAKFANVTGMSANKYKNLGSAIVDLGNNFATTEADIVAMSTRLASTGSLAGLSQPQILALAAAMSSVGIEAEAGGSAMSKLLKQIQLSTELGGKKLSQFASVAGVSGNQFKKIFEKDAVRALGLFIDGLNDTDRNGKSAIAILDEMGIKEVRLSNTILALANSNGLMTKAVDTSTKAWGENTALQTEAEKRYATTAAKLNQTKEAAREVGIMFGEVVLPPLAKMAEGFKNLLGKLSKTNPALKTVVVVLTLMAAAIGPLLMALGSMARGLSVATGAWAKHTTAVSLGHAATIRATIATKAHTVAMKAANLVVKANPYILAAAAIAGLTAVIVTAISKTKSYTEAQKEAAAARQQTIAAAQQEDGVTKNLYDRLVGLEGIQGKTVAQKAEMSAVVDALNHRVSGLNLKYDEEKDKLDKTTKAIYEQITAMHAKALAAAYEKTLTQAYKEQAERQQKLADAKKNLLMYEQKLAEAQRTGADTETWRKRIKASEKSINDLTTGVKNGEKELKNLSSTVGSFKTFEQLTIQAKEAGIKIPRGLRDGVLSGKYEVPTSLGEIEALNNKKYANLVAKAKQTGIKIPKNIKDGLASGKMSVAEATASLSKAITDKTSKAKDKTKKHGQQAGGAFAKGINDKRDDARKSGGNLVIGLWNGIHDKIDWIIGKIKGFGSTLLKKLKNVFKEHSPSKATAEIGRYLTEGLGLGIEDAGKFAIKKALGVAGSVVDAMAVSVPAAQIQAAKAGSILSRPQPSIGDDVASAVGTTLAMAGSSPQQINITVELGGTKVGEKIVKLYDTTKRAVGK